MLKNEAYFILVVLAQAVLVASILFMAMWKEKHIFTYTANRRMILDQVVIPEFGV